MKRHLAASLLVAFLVSSPQTWAANGIKLSGSLAGSVKDVTGIPQMGATVLLFNRYDKLIQKAFTDTKGDFTFDALIPDMYSVKVTLSSFVPALKRNVSVQPGMKSFLAINLASVLSSVELVYTAPQPGTLMSDDWKWVLRSSMATRPVLRLLPELGQSSSQGMAVFSNTHGLLRVSSGEGSGFAADQTDLGTAFAFATSLYGNHRLRFSGNMAHTSDGSTPAAGFRTTFSRMDEGAGPELKLTMQQIMLPARTLTAMRGGAPDNLPTMRRLSLTLIERAELAEGVQLDYGTSLESVQFFDRLNYASPFARLSIHVGDYGAFELGYSSGAPPVDLIYTERESDPLQQDLTALSVIPRVSLRGGRAQVERSQNYEIGYRWSAGGTTLAAGVYRDQISNAALTMAGSGDSFGGADLLPDLSSSSYVFNMGTWRRQGYTVSASQTIGEQSLLVATGEGGVLHAADHPPLGQTAQDVRNLLHSDQERWVMVRASGVAPLFGTRYVTSYQWTGKDALVPSRVFLTQRYFSDAGLNIRIRQPIPFFGLLAGRLEASAEMRNLLAQGYLSIPTSAGRRILLTHTPRSVRGGLSFIF